MKAGQLKKEGNIPLEELTSVVPENEIIDPSVVAAYHLEDGTAESIIDPETQLILAERIDQASETIAEQFDKLLDLQYG